MTVTAEIPDENNLSFLILEKKCFCKTALMELGIYQEDSCFTPKMLLNETWLCVLLIGCEEELRTSIIIALNHN